MDGNGKFMLFELKKLFGFGGVFFVGRVGVKKLLLHSCFDKPRSQAFAQQQAGRMTDGDHDPGEPQPCSPSPFPFAFCDYN